MTPSELQALIARGEYMEILAQPMDMTEQERDIVMALSSALSWALFGNYSTDETFYQCFLHVKAALLSGKEIKRNE